MQVRIQRTALKTHIDFRTAVAIGLTVVLWASSYAGIRIALQGYTPEHLALLRYLTASAALGVYALLTRMPLPRREHLLGLVLLGLVGFSLYNVAINAGEKQISAGVASIIIASGPIFVTLMARMFLKERLTVWAWVGIVVCFSGVALIAFNGEDGWRLSPSALLVLVAAIAQSVYIVGQKPYLRCYTPVQFTTYAIWAGALFLLVFLPGLPEQIAAAPLKSTAAVIYMGVLPGAGGYMAWSYVLARLPASQAGSFMYLIPATAILIAWVGLGEVPAPLAFVGGALILVGVIVVNTRGRARPVSASPRT